MTTDFKAVEHVMISTILPHWEKWAANLEPYNTAKIAEALKQAFDQGKSLSQRLNNAAAEVARNE